MSFAENMDSRLTFGEGVVAVVAGADAGIGLGVKMSFTTNFESGVGSDFLAAASSATMESATKAAAKTEAETVQTTVNFEQTAVVGHYFPSKHYMENHILTHCLNLVIASF